MILFHVYDILCSNAGRDLVYSEICAKYNERYAQSKKRCGVQYVKMTTLDVAHYCKKLEKIGFVNSVCNATTSEKKISLRKRDLLKTQQARFIPDLSQLFTHIPSPAKTDEVEGRASRRKRLESETVAQLVKHEPI